MSVMSLRNQPYLPLYVRDFNSDEKLVNCSAESTGVYIRLMCVMHKMEEYGVITLKQKFKQNESNIKNFSVMLTRYLPYDREVIERGLAELIEERVLMLDGDRLYQKRMVEDANLSKKRSEAGYKGGKSKKYSDFTKSDTEEETEITSKTKNKTESKAEANSEIENEYESNRKKSSSLVSLSKLQEERFNAFWRAYPRRSGKGSARKAWAKIVPNEELFQRIMSAVESASKTEQWRRDYGQFIPYPGTWLNQERWDDDYGEGPKIGSSSGFDPDNPYADWGDE